MRPINRRTGLRPSELLSILNAISPASSLGTASAVPPASDRIHYFAGVRTGPPIDGFTALRRQSIDECLRSGFAVLDALAGAPRLRAESPGQHQERCLTQHIRWRESLLWLRPRSGPRSRRPPSLVHILCHVVTCPEHRAEVAHTAGISGSRAAETAAWRRAPPPGADENCRHRDGGSTPVDPGRHGLSVSSGRPPMFRQRCGIPGIGGCVARDRCRDRGGRRET
jgi:hypothetical protein